MRNKHFALCPILAEPAGRAKACAICKFAFFVHSSAIWQCIVVNFYFVPVWPKCVRKWLLCVWAWDRAQNAWASLLFISEKTLLFPYFLPPYSSSLNLKRNAGNVSTLLHFNRQFSHLTFVFDLCEARVVSNGALIYITVLSAFVVVSGSSWAGEALHCFSCRINQ